MSVAEHPGAPPPAPEPKSHEVNPWFVLVLVCLAQFMVVLDATIVNVALPSIQAASSSRPPSCSG